MDVNILAVTSDDGTEYSLTEPPNVESKIVVEAQKNLTETLQISALSNDLSNVGKFLLMAYCGVVGHADLEVKVRERLYSITKLCDDAVFTLNEFDRTSDKAIRAMVTAYNYLIDGYEDLAFAMLKDVAKLSQKMVEASSKLQERFANESKEVEKVQTQTMGQRQKVDDANTETKKAITQYTCSHDSAQSQLQETTVAEKQSAEKLNEAIYKENAAAENRKIVLQNLADKLEEVQRQLEKANDKVRECANRSSGFIDGVVHFFGGKTKEDRQEEIARIEQQNAERNLDIAREQYYTMQYAENERAKVLQQQREILEDNLKIIRLKQEKAAKEMAELAKKLIQCNIEADMQAESLDCLRYAVTALRNLQDIMVVAGNFWRNWVSFCNEFSTTSFTKRIDNFMKMDKETRKRLICCSRAFKLEAVKYYSKWVAVQQVCFNSRDSITDSQRKLHNYIRQCPTKEESRAILEVLAKEFDREYKPLAITPTDPHKIAT